MQNIRKRELFTPGRRPVRRGCEGALASLVCALAACSPTFNWREVHVDGGLSATFPCKPEVHERRVAVAGRALEMRLLSCEAGGVLWALGTADAKDPSAVDEVLSSLQQAAGANIGAAARSQGPASVPGATPFPAAGRVTAEGRRRDGSPAEIESWVFARGTRVFQASVVRRQAVDAPLQEAQGQFFSSLGFPVQR